MRYNYKDFCTRKSRYTNGELVNVQRGGVLGVLGGVFKRRRSVLFIPLHCLTHESRERVIALTLQGFSPQLLTMYLDLNLRQPDNNDTVILPPCNQQAAGYAANVKMFIKLVAFAGGRTWYSVLADLLDLQEQDGQDE